MIKLLLVEDDPNLRYVVQCGLEDIIGGYDVQTAVNGEEVPIPPSCLPRPSPRPGTYDSAISWA